MNAAGTVLRIGVTLSCALLTAGLLMNAVPIVNAGLLILIVTPLLRVLVVTRLFVANREWAFTAISIGVLFLIGVSLILALQ